MRAAGKDVQDLCVPLRLLHPFWDLDCCYPQKKIVEVILTTQPDSNIFLKAPDSQKEYKFEIQVSTDKYVCDWVLVCFFFYE